MPFLRLSCQFICAPGGATSRVTPRWSAGLRAALELLRLTLASPRLGRLDLFLRPLVLPLSRSQIEPRRGAPHHFGFFNPVARLLDETLLAAEERRARFRRHAH